jgi:CTP synthase (UTP-ammonia lyase)
MSAALAAIRFARETRRPFLGTCGGFQHALLEYARNVLGHLDAEHAETSPHAPLQLIAPLACSLVEKSGTIFLANNSTLMTIYGRREIEEQYHCNYGLNPDCERLLNGCELQICGRDAQGAVRAVELRKHPYFIATLFQPERAALRALAHPLVNAFVVAAQSGQPTHDDRASQAKKDPP